MSVEPRTEPARLPRLSELDDLFRRLDQELPVDRAERIAAIRGRFAWLPAGTEEFMREKQREIEREDREAR